MVAKDNGLARKAQSRLQQDQAPQVFLSRRQALPRPVEFDRLIHEQIRLGIVSALAVNDSLSFNDLKRILKTTDGNLSVHARKLETAEYVTCRKSFQGRIPKTEYRLTAQGRRALERYLERMEALIQAARLQES
jgi:DNA-binding HxlR family transcriptional regulator